MKLIFASNNLHKLEEVRKILPAEVCVLSLNDIGFHHDIEETGTTLSENSRIKAEAVHEWLQHHPEVEWDGIFADDTGLEIAALNGAPGVYTARWAGEDCVAANNRAKALNELQGETNRAARFRTVVTLIRGEKTEQVDGIVDGEIATEERGEGGFGYDPVFIPAGYDKTFAELPTETKNSISHRARAMEALRKILMLIAVFVGTISSWAGTWKSYFAYTSVTQIAETQDKIFALSEGALFSVEKLTEQTATYDGLSGLHSTGIRYIFSDSTTGKLVVMYTDGKMDILQSNGKFIYSSDLYNKQMIESKRINNATVENGMAYMAMPFGILVYDIRKEEFAATYLIGDSAKNVNVVDVVLHSDSIFAIGDSLTYAAARNTDLRNYQSWHAELRSNRIVPDANKGKVITDASGTIWRAGGSNGVQCTRVTGEQKNYLPNGPLNNIPYRLQCHNGTLYMLSGGRWAAPYNLDGNVMILRNGRWTNISAYAIRQITGVSAKDFMNVAVDPEDENHFWLTSYGTGLYEFQNNQCINRFTGYNSELPIETIVPEFPDRYTLLDCAKYDSNGNLRLLDARVVNTFIVRSADGNWGAFPLICANDVVSLNTPGMMCIDRRNENITWISNSRTDEGVYMHNNGGTLLDSNDDVIICRKKWMDADNTVFTSPYFFTLTQTSRNDIWVGTFNGVIIIEDSVDFATSNHCKIVKVIGEDGINLLADEPINAIEEDSQGNIWVGTEKQGVYVFDPDGETLIAHYTNENSLMPANTILALANDAVSDIMYVGTGSGLVSYSTKESTGTNNNINQDDNDGIIGEWTLYPSLQSVSDIAWSQNTVYGLANGNLMSVDVPTGEVRSYDKSNGLSGSSICHLQYDDSTRQTILIYTNGMIDLIYRNTIYPMVDLYMKSEDMEVIPNQTFVQKGTMYLAMPFGVVEINLVKREIVGTYYIGDEASVVNVLSVTATNDSIFAMTDKHLYSIAKTGYPIDYRRWNKTEWTVGESRKRIIGYKDHLYLFADSLLMCKTAVGWDTVPSGKLNWASCKGQYLLAYCNTTGLMQLEEDTMRCITRLYAKEAVGRNGWYWMAGASLGLRRLYSDGTGSRDYSMNSPVDNDSYRLQYIGNTLYVVAGGRWAAPFRRPGTIKYFENGEWNAITSKSISDAMGIDAQDVMSVAVDPRDEKHMFAACYGRGLLEFYDKKVIERYTKDNSTLSSIVAENPNNYTCTDGSMFDAQGNLFVLNVGTQGYPVNILTSDKHWVGIKLFTSSNQPISFTTPCSDMVIDNRNPNWKWMADVRTTTGVILWDDNGTLYNNADDKALKRNSFVDQKGKPVLVENIYCLAQDKKGVVWVGTNAGLILIDHENFFTSDKCSRVIIRRNDGTDLADYLLAEEQINAIAVDGANRKWIGTANSGIYLVSADGQETIHHFTAENSNLPSSEILSITINPKNGDVFVGTAAGIASYRSDATEPKEDMSSVYAYPNPVRPDYVGEIAITGLMDESWVNIVDAGGNIVCKTRSYGGTATWDGCDQAGRRVASGVYSALCNAGDGSGHTVVKILIMR